MQKNLSSITKLVLIQFAIINFNASAQTNVSGGIYTNTTWTHVNSPYIATDSLVVFPGVTLTVEPGVEIRFDNGVVLEIRGTLNATGTQQDTIKWVSNSSSAPQSWVGLLVTASLGGKVTIRFCRFESADNAIEISGTSPSTMSNSIFENNFRGIYGGYGYTIDSCYFLRNSLGGVWAGGATISNCVFIGNNTAIASSSSPSVSNSVFCGNRKALYCSCSVQNTIITNNQIGIDPLFGPVNLTNSTVAENDTGIIIKYSGNTLNQNNICNNLLNILYQNNENIQLANNCWCTTDSATIESTIYHGYDNVSLGLINFTPVLNCDTSVLQVTDTCLRFSTGVAPVKALPFTLLLYPNPLTDFSVVKVNKELNNAHLIITNLMGQNILDLNHLSGSEFPIHRSALPSGLFIIQIAENGKTIFNSKLLVL